MKKLLAGLLVAGMLSITTAPVFAAAKIKDVDANYWARTEIAEVVEVGPGEKIKGELQEMYVKKGDNVIVSKYAGTEVKYEGQEYIIVKQDDILAIVD